MSDVIPFSQTPDSTAPDDHDDGARTRPAPLHPFELVRRAERRLFLLSRLLSDNATAEGEGQINNEEQYAVAELLEELAFDLRDAENARAKEE